METMPAVGQKVRVNRNIIDPPTGDSPGCVCAYDGDIVIVRSLSRQSTYPVAVSHKYRTDGATFSVDLTEIDEVEEPS